MHFGTFRMALSNLQKCVLEYLMGLCILHITVHTRAIPFVLITILSFLIK